jgi:hypothetical protein
VNGSLNSLVSTSLVGLDRSKDFRSVAVAPTACDSELLDRSKPISQALVSEWKLPFKKDFISEKKSTHIYR